SSSQTAHTQRTTLFPYTTLFRSQRHHDDAARFHLPLRMLGEEGVIDLAVLGEGGGNRGNHTLPHALAHFTTPGVWPAGRASPKPDRKSTRLNSSHVKISYAVFCL